MHGEILLVVLILTLGCAAFFFCVVYVFCRFLAWMGRGALGLFTRPRRKAVRVRVVENGPYRICPREQCRKVERRPARFCSRCGARLPQTAEYELF